MRENPSSSAHPKTVLIPHRPLGNIYVRELGTAYASAGVQPIYGPENLLDSDLVPTYLHLHWPESIYHAQHELGLLKRRIAKYLHRLDRLYRLGTRIIWTVHNLKPHELEDEGAELDAYQGTIDRAHVIHHHCPCSAELLASRFRISTTSQSIVVPHGHYLGYPIGSTQPEARRHLGIDPSAFVFLLFGQIRQYKGVGLVERAFRKVDVPRKHLIVAGRPPPARPLARIALTGRRALARNTTYQLNSIPHDDVHWFLQACDAVVLGHTEGLNSGVAVLAMTFGKPVVGPRLGCIEWVLQQGRNILYEPGDVAKLRQAMQDVSQFDMAAVAMQNKSVAASWTWEQIASKALATSESTARSPLGYGLE